MEKSYAFLPLCSIDQVAMKEKTNIESIFPIDLNLLFIFFTATKYRIKKTTNHPYKRLNPPIKIVHQRYFYANAECRGRAGALIVPKSIRITCRIFPATGLAFVAVGVPTRGAIPTTRCSITKAP